LASAKPGRFLILAAVLAPLVIVANLAATQWSSLRCSAGLVTGMVVAMFVIARMSPPAWIENWQDGAIGWPDSAQTGIPGLAHLP